MSVACELLPVVDSQRFADVLALSCLMHVHVVGAELKVSYPRCVNTSSLFLVLEELARVLW